MQGIRSFLEDDREQIRSATDSSCSDEKYDRPLTSVSDGNDTIRERTAILTLADGTTITTRVVARGILNVSRNDRRALRYLDQDYATADGTTVESFDRHGSYIGKDNSVDFNAKLQVENCNIF